MFEVAQIKKEWSIDYREEGYIRRPFIRIVDGKESIEVFLSTNPQILNANGNFYGFADESILREAHVIPGQLLSFTIHSALSERIKSEVTISKQMDSYSVVIYSAEYNDCCFYSPKKDIKEILTGKELAEKLNNIEPTFMPYPFLQLPFGNCFSL